MKNTAIIKRIENILGIDHFLEALDRLSPTDLQSLLLALYERRSENATVQSVFDQYEKNRFVFPSVISQKIFAELEIAAFKILPPDFEMIELSPVAPFGTNSALTRNNQKKIMSTVRNLEVCADSTTALILECARRRKKILRISAKSAQEVKCATSMRNIRLQNFERIPGFIPHFKALTLATAGRDCGSETFETQSCLEHISFPLDFLNQMTQSGFGVEKINISLSDIRIMEKVIDSLDADRKKIGRETQNPGFDMFRNFQIPLPANAKSVCEILDDFVQNYGLEKNMAFLSIAEEKIMQVLIQKYPNTNITIDLGRIAGIGYYSDLCFKITACNKKGEIFPLADGGMVDWTQKLLQSRKERAFASGFGMELFCQNFKL